MNQTVKVASARPPEAPLVAPPLPALSPGHRTHDERRAQHHDELELPPGNLQAHLAALEKAGYIEIKKALIELKPRTRYVITARGSAAVKAYAAYLEGVLADVARVVEGQADEGPR